MSVREYAINYTGKGGKAGGRVVGGGNAVLKTDPHALDGLEHAAPADGTRLDASATAHGLMPKVAGAASYVVGEPQGLPNEIVVGATPGGDLGGTWGSPTVEAVNGVTVSGTPAVGLVLAATSSTTAAWMPLASVGVRYWPMLSLTSNP